MIFLWRSFMYLSRSWISSSCACCCTWWASAYLQRVNTRFNLLLLLGQAGLDALQVQQFRAELERQRQLLLEHLPVGLDLLRVAVLQLSKSLGVLLLGLQEILVPLRVELLILLDVGLLAFLSLLGLLEDKFFVSSLIVLVLELGNSVFGHFSLDVLALDLTRLSVLFQHLTTRPKIFKINSLFHHRKDTLDFERAST